MERCHFELNEILGIPRAGKSQNPRAAVNHPWNPLGSEHSQFFPWDNRTQIPKLHQHKGFSLENSPGIPGFKKERISSPLGAIPRSRNLFLGSNSRGTEFSGNLRVNPENPVYPNNSNGILGEFTWIGFGIQEFQREELRDSVGMGWKFPTFPNPGEGGDPSFQRLGRIGMQRNFGNIPAQHQEES